MDVRAIAFDLNGTLIDILTEDHREDIFRAAGHLLTYQGIELRRNEVRDLYFEAVKQQRRLSSEQYPEFDAVAAWRTVIDDHATEFTGTLPPAKVEQLPLLLAEMCRGISRRRLQPFPYVHEVLDDLRGRLPLAVVSDGQSSWARGELHKAGLSGYFDPIVISGDYGYRKPDRRLFQLALDGMGVSAANTVYVGNDMHRDIYGAREAGLITVMIESPQGTNDYEGCVPDFTISDLRELLEIVDG
jgi:putative hydrolase of the HAD superfamily